MRRPIRSSVLPIIHKRAAFRILRSSLAWLIAIAVAPLALRAEEPPSSTLADREMVQVLLQRIERLEARVAQLEAGQPQPERLVEVAAQTTTPQQQTPPEPMPEPVEPSRMDASKTLMQIRGFGDVTFHGDNQKGDTTSFTLGQLDLFVTSDVSEKFRFLSEIVFEAGGDNVFGVDLERLLLQYAHSDYLNVSVGRYHTAIGYYNTAYHHSTWLQTATGRPFLFQFEDDGGLLPIHNVGVSATGLIPSGKLGLHWIAEIGNGRASKSPSVEPVQNEVDENNGKSFNLALYARPQAVRGLQTGFSVYHDHLYPLDTPSIGQTIVDAYAVIERPSFEWLNEAVLIHHSPSGPYKVYDTPGFYTQISKPFGSYRPYFRYQYINASDSEPVFGYVGLRQGPSVGLRFDASEAVALKLQYDYTSFRHQDSVSGLALQLGFTF